MNRNDGRLAHELRLLTIAVDSYGYAEGSALIRMGDTQVLCAASVEENVPPWMRGQARGQKRGWVTGEYAMLPRATASRTRRERNGPGGRTQEIQRLIGRSLRAAVDLTLLGERTITIDCDVLKADGGTRTASITGGYVALALAIQQLIKRGDLSQSPLIRQIAAISAGYVAGQALLDLDYSEDSTADLDCNLVQSSDGAIIELQCTAEARPISRSELDALVDLASAGIQQLIAAQQQVLATSLTHAS